MTGSRTLGVAAATLLLVPATALAAPQTGDPITYARHVAPILQEKCQVCHQPNSVGRMALMTYEDARTWAGPLASPIRMRAQAQLFVSFDSWYQFCSSARAWTV